MSALRLDPGNPKHMDILRRVNPRTGKPYIEEYRAFQFEPNKNFIITGSEKRKPKYGNKKHVVSGIEFDSIWEAECYLALQDLEKNKFIYDLQRQVKYEFAHNGIKVWGCVFDFEFRVPDTFSLTPGKFIAVTADAKSRPTMDNRVWRTTVKMMKAFYGREILSFIKGETRIDSSLIKNFVFDPKKRQK